MIYLDENQVRNLIKEAEGEGEVISVRCIRKGKGDASKGTAQGELHTLMCSTKPEYESKTGSDGSERKEEDAVTHTLTVWAVNRKTAGKTGGWRRVNLEAVQEVRYKEEEYKVTHS
jgi:hypothetical protein